MTDIEDNKLAKSNDNQDSQEEFAEVIDALPDNFRKVIVTLFQQQNTFHSPSPLQEKVTPEHISKVLEIAAMREQQKQRRESSVENTRRLGLVLLGLLIFGVLLFVGITKDRDFGVFVTGAVIGALGGYGYGKGTSQSTPDDKK